MDHITYPQDAVVPPITIPYYLREEHIYDGQGVDGFLARKRFKWPPPSSLTPEMEAGMPHVLDTSMSLAQSWLFFGLIEECHKLLTPLSNVFSRSDYIVDNNGRRSLTTTPVMRLLLDWELWDRELDENKRRSLLLQVKVILEKGVGYATGLMELAWCVKALGWVDEDRCLAIEELTLCIYCLCEALGKPGSMYKINFSKMNTNEPGILRNRFHLSGFCPKDVKFLKYQTFTVRYAASALDRRSDVISHKSCTEDSCVHDKIDETSYVRVHADGCDVAKCFDITPCASEDGDVSQILLDGGIPVVRLSATGDTCEVLRVTVHEFASIDYVALSHVWSDGLGNIKDNAIRICQLRRLQAYVNKLFPDLPSHVPFWMDTLCVPKDKTLKKIAIKKMKLCYETAKKVLVLDSVILRNPVAREPNDAFLSIATCRWRFRLWTLQEAIFAKELYFQAKDEPFNLNTFDDYYNSKFPPMPNEPASSALNTTFFRTPIRRMHMQPLLSDITLEISGLYPMLHGLKQDWQILERINMTLAYRTTTNKEDEAICIASILGYDPSCAVGLDHEEAMIAVFSSLRSVPLGLLFSSRPKIEKPGWRWLPKTLLWHGGEQAFTSSEGGCSVDHNGIFVDLPGAKLCLDNLDNSLDAGKRYVKTRYYNENIVISIDSKLGHLDFCDLKSSDKSICVITRHILQSDGFRNALAVLVALDSISADGVQKVEWLANLVVAVEAICPFWYVETAPVIEVLELYEPSQKWQIG